jgi:hypothetical protein
MDRFQREGYAAEAPTILQEKRADSGSPFRLNPTANPARIWHQARPLPTLCYESHVGRCRSYGLLFLGPSKLRACGLVRCGRWMLQIIVGFLFAPSVSPVSMPSICLPTSKTITGQPYSHVLLVGIRFMNTFHF